MGKMKSHRQTVDVKLSTKLQNVQLTSKKKKNENIFKKKLKNYGLDRKDECKKSPAECSLLNLKRSKKITKKNEEEYASREQNGNETIDASALDEYFRSVDEPNEQPDNVDTFGDSICDVSSLENSACNISFGSMVPDSVSSVTLPHVSDTSVGDFVEKKRNKKREMKVAFPMKEETIEFHSLPNNMTLVVLHHPSSLYFQGQLNVRVITGCLEILGCTLTNGISKHTEIFSPGGSSLLCFTSCKSDILIDESSVEKSLTVLGMNPELSKSIIFNMKESDCLALIEKGHSEFASYLSSQCSIYLYPRILNKDRPFIEEENKLHCQFETDKRNVSRGYTKLTEWDDLADAIISDGGVNPGSTIIMVCGGKSVGKSTLLRFLINKALRHFHEVLCLDFDPGQSEFTVPGCVSAVKIRDPLVGPNFTHLLTPERRVYVGDVDISKCPNRYIKCVEHILDYYKSQSDLINIVCFVNTMGFNKGLGVDLTTCLIHMVQPSRLVQIESRSAKRNFPSLLTADYAASSDSQWCRKLVDTHTKLSYSHHVLQSAAEKKVKGEEANWGMQPKTARDVMLLSYLSQMLQAPRYSLTGVIPIGIQFSQITLCVCHETVGFAHYLSVMNAALVGLCVTNSHDNIFYPSDPSMPSVLANPPVGPCLGFGVVRGIDMVSRVLYLITPLPLEEVKSVNCLVLGAVMLPTCVYTKPGSGIGHIPYVSMGPGQATSKGISRRFFQPLNQ